MSIEKLKSGSYRIRIMSDGVVYRKTLDHKPSTKELKIITGEMLAKSEEKKVESGSFARAYKDYIESRMNTCSPSTLRGYDSVFRNIPEWFRKKNVYDITKKDAQKVINEYAADHSPKSVYNLNSLVHAVLKEERPGMELVTKIPDRIPKEVYIPSNEEVDAILEDVRGTKYEVPLTLAALGLRRSEICALTIEDLHGNMLSVTKAKVKQRDEEWVVKPYTKTPESVRDVYIPDHIRDLIVERGYVYKGDPGRIDFVLKQTEKKLGIQDFSLHKLRHYYASEMHAMGASEANILANGGWKTNSIMNSVYRHARKATDDQIKFADRFNRAAE